MYYDFTTSKVTKIIWIAVTAFLINIFFEYLKFNHLKNNLRQLDTDIVRLSEQIQIITAEINNLDYEESCNVNYAQGE